MKKKIFKGTKKKNFFLKEGWRKKKKNLEKITKIRQEKREGRERQKGRSEDQTHQSKGLYKKQKTKQ